MSQPPPATADEMSDANRITMQEILAREVRSGFDSLRGATIAGHVPIAQSVINELLALSGESLSRVTVDVHGGNTLVIRYRTFISIPVTVVLDDTVDVQHGAPRITLTIRSSLLAGLLSMKTMPFVAMDGNRVTIDTARIPALAPFAGAWRCLQSIRLSTSEQMLFVDVNAGVPVS